MLDAFGKNDLIITKREIETIDIAWPVDNMRQFN